MQTQAVRAEVAGPRRAVGWGWAAAAGAVVALYALGEAGWVSSYVTHVLCLVGINIILTASLNLVNGYLGEFAIGRAGFMAVGAYIAGVLTVKLDLPFALAFLAAGVAAGLVAWLVGIPAFTMFGDYLAIVTLGFNMSSSTSSTTSMPWAVPGAWWGCPRRPTCSGCTGRSCSCCGCSATWWIPTTAAPSTPSGRTRSPPT